MTKLVIIAEANQEGEVTEVSPFRVADDEEAAELAEEATAEARDRAGYFGGHPAVVMVLDELVVGDTNDLREWIKESREH